MIPHSPPTNWSCLMGPRQQHGCLVLNLRSLWWWVSASVTRTIKAPWSMCNRADYSKCTFSSCWDVFGLSKLLCTRTVDKRVHLGLKKTHYVPVMVHLWQMYKHVLPHLYFECVPSYFYFKSCVFVWLHWTCRVWPRPIQVLIGSFPVLNPFIK